MSEAEGYDWRTRYVKGNVELHKITAQLRDVGLVPNGGKSGVRRDIVSDRAFRMAKDRKLDELTVIGSWIDDAAVGISR